MNFCVHCLHHALQRAEIQLREGLRPVILKTLGKGSAGESRQRRGDGGHAIRSSRSCSISWWFAATST